MPAGAESVTTITRSGAPSPATRAWRSGSQNSTLGARSASAACSSSRSPKLLSGAGIAPSRAVATKATAHSGRLRMAIATRSPGHTPALCSQLATASASAKKRVKVQVSPWYLM